MTQSFDVAVVGLGALGSAAAYQLARRGVTVVAFEQFELGHVRGASHDTSRILRTSYGETRYVRLAQSAYRDWADLERVSGERLVTTTGGLIFAPTGGPYSAGAFASSLTETGLPYDELTPADVHSRWPQFRVPDGVETIWTSDTAIVHAARTVAVLQLRARVAGAELRPDTPVTAVRPGAGGVLVETAAGAVRARKVILATDAWTNELLAPLGAEIPLVTMQEQVTYFKPADPAAYDPARFPVWVWLDTNCYYGFPTYGEPTIKAARDVSNNYMAPAERTFEPSAELLGELTGFMHATIPGSGPALRTVTCQYALTADREFVLGPLAGYPDLIVALGAGHAFKFTPAIGRILADLALDGATSDDISAFSAEPKTPA
ncbi:N-methyl-L-tryptophan oxidase [Cryptosporangium japonicum]